MNRLLPAMMIAVVPVMGWAQDMAISDGYARAANPKSGAAFMTMRNAGAAACTLTGVTSDAAARVELHTHREENGLMTMGPADPITIAPGAVHRLARGGDHVMLMGLHQPLRDGQSVVLVMDFGSCGQVPVSLTVENARLPGQQGDAHSAH